MGNKPVAIILCLLLSLLGHIGTAAGEETLTFGRFGKVRIYRDAPAPSRVVLFISGDGGWNLGVVDMANSLASLDALVAGIDIVHYLKEIAAAKEECSYCAADFEALSQYVQKTYQFPQYVPPVLVGYSSGATLAYTTLVQAPAGTFQGAISLGFCPDLPLVKPLCRGAGLEWQTGAKGKGYIFLPAPALQTPWIAFQGAIDQVCDPKSTAVFVQQVGTGRIVLLPKVGHGFSVLRNWLPQFKDAFQQIAVNNPQAASLPDALEDLPLIEVPADHGTKNVAILWSGDGGWAGIDRDLARALAEGGVSVIGVNSLQYFWRPRTPEGAAQDLSRILQHYREKWHPEKICLIGYSLGADDLPFMVNRLPHELQQHIDFLALLGPGEFATFEFKITEWLGGQPNDPSLRVLPEIEKIRGVSVLCFYGDQEKNALCAAVKVPFVRSIALPGRHHFGGNYQAIAKQILAAFEQK